MRTSHGCPDFRINFRVFDSDIATLNLASLSCSQGPLQGAVGSRANGRWSQAMTFVFEISAFNRPRVQVQSGVRELPNLGESLDYTRLW
jgi:hypothetical protein